MHRAPRCFAALSMTVLSRLLLPPGVTLSAAKGLARGSTRDASLRLSMTGLSRKLPPSVVTLSAAKGLSRWVERCFAEFTLSEANVLSMTVL
ncbi:MAG TPA: hypothetical protein VFZ02_04410 [Ktedonobacteraceae bacterium]